MQPVTPDFNPCEFSQTFRVAFSTVYVSILGETHRSLYGDDL